MTSTNRTAAPPGRTGLFLRLGTLAVTGAIATAVGVLISPDEHVIPAAVGTTKVTQAAVDKGVKTGCRDTDGSSLSDDACARDVITGAISKQLLQSLAKDLSVTVTQAEIEAAISSAQKAQGGADAFYESARKAGLSREQVDALVKDTLLPNAIAAALIAKRPPSTADIKAFYDANPKQFVVYHLSHILSTDKATADSVAAKAKAAPDTFSQLAKTFSTSTDDKDKGGALPPITQVQYESILGSQGGQPATGVFIGPLAVQQGFDLIYVTSVSHTTLEQASETITKVLAQPGSPYSQALVAAALSAKGHQLGVTVDKSYGTWDFAHVRIIPPK